MELEIRYGGRKRSLAPAVRIARRTARPLGTEIVHGDDVARDERQYKNLLDIGKNPRPLIGPIGMWSRGMIALLHSQSWKAS